VPEAPDEVEVEAALEAERQFVLSLGGYAYEVAGARFVTHEKVPSARFNFVEVREVHAERQTAFFERALDHYFQRALRPVFRLPKPVAGHLDRCLRRLGFVPRASELTLLVESGAPAPAPPDRIDVRPASPAELDTVVGFWTEEKERPELRTALDVLWHHPNPPERLVPLLATLGGTAASAALAYRFRRAVGLHLVTTLPPSRGQGAASALVAYARREEPTGPGASLSLFAEAPEALPPLTRLGLVAARSFVVYELPATAELALPRPGPPGPPQWRPPRNARPA
jgi:hypothetical protein